MTVKIPRHYKYMFEFRTNQCEKFIDHKCTFHKPYNCFDWHFPNQRRRVPIQLQDGTFNYNPDLYCNAYDQNTGICPNDPNCKYVHMNVGDTERRYHPRYYKTGMCIYETGSDGICGKNGLHCAFAHDQLDVRQPLLDVRETFNNAPNLSAQLEKERVLTEDPIWNEMDYVLAFYKTEECRKQPKTCRQGYACPFYHNSKDRRRKIILINSVSSGIGGVSGSVSNQGTGGQTNSSTMCSYQSQPCPRLKPINEEWQDVAFCNEQDQCKFSHSRTEQQFHPEIFKSSKCNDILRENFCPRGPFCAFCHTDAEMNNGQYLLMLENALNKYAGRIINNAKPIGDVDISTSSSGTSNSHRKKSLSMCAPASSSGKSSSGYLIGGTGSSQCLNPSQRHHQYKNPQQLFQHHNHQQLLQQHHHQQPALLSYNINTDLVNDSNRSHSFLNVFHHDQYLSSPISSTTNRSSDRCSPASCPGREPGILIPMAAQNPMMPISVDSNSELFDSGFLPRNNSFGTAPMGLANIDTSIAGHGDAVSSGHDGTSYTDMAYDEFNQPLKTPTPNNSFDIFNLKTILERALSNSSSIQKMSEGEIGKLLAQYSQDPQSTSSPKYRLADSGASANEIDRNTSSLFAPLGEDQDLHLAGNWKSSNEQTSQQNESSTDKLSTKDNYILIQSLVSQIHKSQQELITTRHLVRSINRDLIEMRDKLTVVDQLDSFLHSTVSIGAKAVEQNKETNQCCNQCTNYVTSIDNQLKSINQIISTINNHISNINSSNEKPKYTNSIFP